MNITSASRARPDRRRRKKRQRPAGFTLLEIIVATVVGIAFIGGILVLFQFNSRWAQVQTHVSDVQHSTRISQSQVGFRVRMTGRGGLPAFIPPSTAVSPAFPGRLLPAGVAVELLSNVPEGTRIGDIDSAKVVAGTDVLTIRGVFDSPIFQIDPDEFDPLSGRISVHYLSPTGVPQDLSALDEAVTAALGGEPEALVLVSPIGADLYAVVELTGGAVVTGTVDGETVPLTVTLEFASTGGEHTSEFLQLSPEGRFPPTLTSVAFVSVLEELRYFVREVHAVEDDPTTPLKPKLTRARYYPGTQVPHPSNTGDGESIAENVLDFQVSLGIDTDGNTLVVEGEDAIARASDEWLFNSPDDTLDNPLGNPALWRWNGPASRVFYLRLTTLARTEKPDNSYRAPPIAFIEDRIYSEPETPNTPEERLERMFRRRLMQTTVDLRNL